MTVSPAEIDRSHVTMGTCSGCAVLLGGAFAGSVPPVPSTVVPSVQFPSPTLGLMGLDHLHLCVLAASSDDPKEKENVKGAALLTCRTCLPP